MKPKKIKINEDESVMAYPISQEKWDRKHRDFKGERLGIKTMTFNENGMTVLKHVYIACEKEPRKESRIKKNANGVMYYE